MIEDLPDAVRESGVIDIRSKLNSISGGDLLDVGTQDGDFIDVAPLERGGLRFLFQLARPDGQPPGMDDDIRRTRPRRIQDQSP